MQAKTEVRVEIYGKRLPGVQSGERRAVRLGIQVGREVVDDIPGDAPEAVFVATVRVSRLADGALDFGGPYVFGTRGDRFLYLCCGERTAWAWGDFARAKIKLGHVPQAIWEDAMGEGLPVVARLELTDAKGRPKCASLRPDEVQWSVERPG